MKNQNNQIYLAFTGKFEDEETQYIRNSIKEIFPNSNEVAFVHNQENVDYSELIYEIQKPVFSTEHSNKEFFISLYNLFAVLKDFNPYFTRFKKEVVYND